MRIRNLLTAAVMIVVFCPLVFSKEWYQLYDDGKKAIDKNNCAQGEKDIKEALRKNPKADLKARPYGTITWEYIPHFYLAKCAAERGDYAAADLYLNEARKVDMYQSSKSSEFRTMVKVVEEKLKPVKPSGQLAGGTKPPGGTTTTTTPPKTGTPTTGTPTTGTSTKPPTGGTIPGGTAGGEASQQLAINRALESARSAYAAGDYDEARSEANRVLMLDRNNREANRLLSQISSRESNELAARAKQQKVEEARRALNRGDLTAAESTILQLRAEYPTDRTIESMANEIQQKRLAQMQGMNESNQRKENERQVVQAYFEGKYSAVIELADTHLEKYPTSWRLHFYKGCAHAALGLLDDTKKDSELNLARNAFRKARSAGGEITKPGQISPKIWEVFKDS